MSTFLIWLGRGCLISGVLLVAINVVMSPLGLSASYNLGDPAKFEFVLISFWHIGAALVGIGILAMIAAIRIGRVPH
jgi:hypothetical protein